MSGPAIHHLIADRLQQDILRGRGLGWTLDPAGYGELQALLNDASRMPYLYLGCQGPDFLFFNTKDIHPALASLVSTYFDVYDFIENFKRDLIEAIPQPVLDALAALDEAANEVVTSSSTLTELEQLFGDLKRIVEGLLALVLEADKRFVSDFDLLDAISHP